MITASAVQLLPIAALLSLGPIAAGPPAEPKRRPWRGAAEIRLLQTLARPRAGEGRSAVTANLFDEGPIPPAPSASPAASARASRLSGREVAVSSKSVVSGRVICALGRPIAEAYLRLNRADGPLKGTTHKWRIAEGDGSFVIDAEPGGTYHLVALPALTRGLEERERLSMGGACLEDLVAPATGLEVRLSRMDRVRGILRDAEGFPLPREHVSLSDPSIGILNWGTTDDSGFFELQVPTSSGIDVSIFEGEVTCGSQVGHWRTVMRVPSSGFRSVGPRNAR